jgi:nitrate reductase NapAB chaperone NapD
MPVCGLVVTLNPHPPQTEAALAALEAHRHISCGPPNGCRLPVVIEADESAAGAALLKWVECVPGVVSTSLVWAAWDD